MGLAPRRTVTAKFTFLITSCLLFPWDQWLCQVSPAMAPVRFCPNGEEETPKSIKQSSGDFKIHFLLLLLSNTELRKLLFIKNEIVMGQWLILIGFRNNSPPTKQVIYFFFQKGVLLNTKCQWHYYAAPRGSGVGSIHIIILSAQKSLSWLVPILSPE